MNNNSPELHGKSFKAMSTEELHAILEAELEANRDMDVEKIRAVTAVLEERTQDSKIDVDQAWEKFVARSAMVEQPDPARDNTSSTNNQRKHSSRRPGRKAIIAIAAVLIFALGTSIVASASGANLIQSVINWSSEVFGFTFWDNTQPTVENPELALLHQALWNDNIVEKLTPNYLPDGYTQRELYADDGLYAAVYSNGNDSITIQVWAIRSNSSAQYENDNVSSEEYKVGGITHFISCNNGLYLAVWDNNNYECAILCVPDKEELILMIDSIYSEGY